MRKKTLVLIFQHFNGYAYRSMRIDDLDNYCTLMVSPNFDRSSVFVVRRVDATEAKYIKNRDELRRGL